MTNRLYHYCSSATAFAILQSRTFRLSPLSAANDTLEGQLVGRTFRDLLLGSGLPRGITDVASVIIGGYPQAAEGFAFCLSEEGDLLSQWRAYARDGTGFAIGFDPAVLGRDFGHVNFGRSFFELVKVDYGTDNLRIKIAPVVDKVREFVGEHGEFVRMRDGIDVANAVTLLADREADISGLFVGRDRNSPSLLDDFMKVIGQLNDRIYETKPQVFYEEKEWRVLRYRHTVPHEEIQYAADDVSIRPFIPCRIDDPAIGALIEIILGPKNHSNVNWVRAFLDSLGLTNVKVRCSNIDSYR